jgi:hypothetical protein
VVLVEQAVVALALVQELALVVLEHQQLQILEVEVVVQVLELHLDLLVALVVLESL